MTKDPCKIIEFKKNGSLMTSAEKKKKKLDDGIDQSSEDSFPASDPPSSTGTSTSKEHEYNEFPSKDENL